ncbi:nocturnin-like isoform X2 [Oratosquilla oratoria]|uniref:nocturnin-like isoform X2 n=1 Tax=Oratosquilla oratoria TaxID=337810 RepID=UPI003F770B66
MFSMKELRESLALAEQLAKQSLKKKQALQDKEPDAQLAPNGTAIRSGTTDDDSNYVPPKQLLLYLVRMGSFTSTPKIANTDHQDDNLQVPADLSQEQLLAWVKSHLVDLPSLPPRKYLTLPSNSPTRTPEGENPLSAANPIRMMQWNVLSQALGVNNDNFVQCPSKALEWSTRRFRMLEEILTYKPDIVCLQEVDHYSLLKRVLHTQGFKGIFFPKPDSPCIYIPDNNGPDGCAIFYDALRFKLLAHETRVVEVWHVQSNQVVIMVTLQEKATGKELVVATTHLKARKGALLSTLRNEQGKDLVEFISQHHGGRPLLVCGDFNAEPCEPVYSTMLQSPLGLQSAYAKLLGGKEPPYTTWKIRGEGEACHTIDYVFYTPSSFQLQGALDFPSAADIGPNRVPSLAYPSDHFSLVCDFNFQADSD